MPIHDQNFKNLILDYPRQALDSFAPEEAERLPRDVRIVPLRQEQLQERLGDTFKELDVPLLVEYPNGEKEAVIFVIENESRERSDFLHYLAIVCLNISLLMKTRRIVPVAVHPFRRKDAENRLTLGGNTRDFLDFSCLSCALGTMDASAHYADDNIVTRLCLPLMAHEPAEKLLVVTRSFEGLAALEPNVERRLKYADFIGQYAALNEAEEIEFREKYVEQSKFAEDIMTLTEMWLERGKKIGLAEGEARGKAMGILDSIVTMYRDGDLTADQARARLKLIGQRQEASPEMVADALRSIAG
jgi:hypothetical protein